MKLDNAVLLVLLDLLHLISGGGDAVRAGGPVSEGSDDYPLHRAGGGGLHWQNLGVSLEPCSITADRMIEKYENKDEQVFTEETGQNHCLEESEWLLHPSSGFVENGCLCGIIGPSGAGKSTFLNVLGGTTPRNSGVYLTGSLWHDECLLDNREPTLTTPSNGKVCHRYHLSQREGDIAFLSQHDNFFDMLTPRESLEFAAYLEAQKRRTEPGVAVVGGSHEETARRKLASLGLTAVSDRRIGGRTRIDGGGGGHLGWGRMWSRAKGGGGLSGGERRRLSVALELVTEPKVFLADEPTTGLDSSQAEKVVRLISTLAKQRNVPSICSLHQPKSSIWRMLDQCIVLAPGGKMCYVGDRKNATTYFASIGYKCPRDTNPAEFFIDLVTIDSDDPVQAVADKARIDSLHRRFVESFSTKNMSQSPGSEGKAVIKRQIQNNRLVAETGFRARFRSVVNSIGRLGALLLRSWRQNIRNGRIISLRLGASIVQAGLFAAIFPSVQDSKSLTKSIADRVALLTFGVVNMSIMALMKSLDLFAKERSVVLREQMRSYYYSHEYLLAKLVAEIPLDTFFAVVFAAVLKRLTGLRTSVITLIKTYCLMTVSSASLGFAIGSVASSVESAMSTGVPIMIIFMVVGVINPSGVDSDIRPNQVMKYLKAASPIRWAIEALVTAEFRGMTFGERDRGRFGQLKELPKMGALAVVRDGDAVLKNLGLGAAEYSDIMEKLAILSGVYLLMSWFGLSYFGPSFIDTDAM